MKTKYKDLPEFSCFSYGGQYFEKQSGKWSRNLNGGFIAWFHDDDEVFEEIPKAWENGKPVFASETKE